VAITTGIGDLFHQELMDGLLDLGTGGHTLRAALYDSTAVMGPTTAAYTASDEEGGTGYTAGGGALTKNGTSITGAIGYVDFADFTWGSSTITCRGTLIYDDTHASNRTILVEDFGANKISTAGDFKLAFPANASTTAIIRIGNG
jgi:hypothetical protein